MPDDHNFADCHIPSGLYRPRAGLQASVGEQLPILFQLAAVHVEPLKPGEFAAECGRLLLGQRILTCAGGCILHFRAEMQMVEYPEGLNRIGCRNPGIFYHDHVIAILFFATNGKV